MKNAVFHLIGPPGVGKCTVGKIIAERTAAKLVDNHYSINPISALIEQDGRTPLPDQIWQQAGKVRSAVLETIATWSPRDWSFVFTQAASDDPSDALTCREILSAAALCGTLRYGVPFAAALRAQLQTIPRRTKSRI